MKKLFSLALSASLLLGLAACGRAPASSGADGVPSSAAESGPASSSAAGQSAAPSGQSVSLPTVSVSMPSGTKTVTGTVQAIGMSAMILETDDGQEVSFSHEGVANMPNLMEGDRATVTYTGTLDNADVYAVEKA